MLTPRQRQIWDFLVDYVDQHGYPPTVRETGEAVGLSPTGTPLPGPALILADVSSKGMSGKKAATHQSVPTAPAAFDASP